jgi:uncharacterized protein YjbI with pentapeptide repeats
LRGSIIKNTKSENLFFKNSNASGVIFDGSKISGMRVEKTNMSGSLFRDSHIEGGKPWTGSKFRNAEFKNSHISHVEFAAKRYQHFTDRYYREPLVRKKIFEGVAALRTRFARVKGRFNLKGVTLNGSVFSKSSFEDLSLSGMSISETTFDKCGFLFSSLSKANVAGSSFTESIFDGVNARGLRAKGSDFSGVFFGSNENACDFSNSDFSDSNFSGAQIGNSKVKGSNWKGAETQTLEVFRFNDNPLTTASGQSGDIPSLKKTSYEHYSLSDAAKKMGIADNAFEFLVLSKAIDVRHNLTKHRVEKDFDVSLNHIPVWQMQNLPQV